MSHRSHRRSFLKASAVAAGGLLARTARGASANERVAFAAIGIGGKGASDTADAAKFGDLVAICDADEARLAAALKKYPKAKGFADYRKLLDAMGKSIDAVTVSTPDHTHAPPALAAMRMGKHCFCQKPLTRTIYEARLMAETARQYKVATQMGNQGTANADLRRGAAWLRAGVVGAVKEIHIWTNRPVWPQGVDRPQPKPCPASLNWDVWLGPAADRPYGDGYHPFKWRGFWDFGSGALGDMGCHNINMAFMGLDLRNPLWVEAQTSGHNRYSLPAWSVVTYQFAATEKRPALKLVWYDGGKLPPAEVCFGKTPGKGGGSVVIGARGVLWGHGELLEGAKPVQADYPESPGHFEEFMRAIRGGEPAMSNFPDYAGALTETVLLGNLAIWAGGRVEWDAAAMKAKNVAGLEPLIKPTYRAGYTLDA